MVYYEIIPGWNLGRKFHPLYDPTKQGFFHCSVVVKIGGTGNKARKRHPMGHGLVNLIYSRVVFFVFWDSIRVLYGLVYLTIVIVMVNLTGCLIL